MNLHFIAIGGSAMHSLAIAMDRLGHKVSGSDDSIFEPSKSNLKNAGLLPSSLGWFPKKIDSEIDIVILGMHSKKDNPELLKAQDIGLNIQSYPEFLSEISKNKTKVVIAGSHGKTTITSMIIHVLKYHGIDIDFMVGAPQININETFEISEKNNFILIEGDEYLSSPIDSKPKFLWYKPEIALISGIAWDHVNVYPVFDEYVKQFNSFISSIRPGGVLIFNDEDKLLKELVEKNSNLIKKIPYRISNFFIDKGITYLETSEGKIPLSIFGNHNLSNLSGAMWISQMMGINSSDFYEAIPTFRGASKRLECLVKGKTSFLFKDFAHAPSKVKATVDAVDKQFFNFEITFCLELHTFSSLDLEFLNQYADTLKKTSNSIIFYDPVVLKNKNRRPISEDYIKKAFDHSTLKLFTDKNALMNYLIEKNYVKHVLVFMSSGNFGGIDWEIIKSHIRKF
ncbi:MAG: peptidoglycan synthetase [Bacteroidota bacterium]|nr:MAG: peptidoglycan synthetase [Bacteroidota bacterium]